MEIVTWAALAVAITAMIASCAVAFWAGRIDSKVNNGFSETIEHIHNNLDKIWERLDSMPCKEQVAKLEAIKEQVRELAKRDG